MPKVLNRYKDNITSNTVYIGRPSKWGNPFTIGKDGTREKVVIKYKEWIQTQPDLIKEVKQELKDKDLMCFCAPKACHGDILLQIANSEP